MKTTILKMVEFAEFEEPFDAVHAVCGAIGSMTDPNIRKWAEHMAGRKLADGEFEEALFELKHEHEYKPNPFEPLEIALCHVFDVHETKPATLEELTMILKALRHWRNAVDGGGANGYLDRQLSFTPAELKKAMKSAGYKLATTEDIQERFHWPKAKQVGNRKRAGKT